MQYFIFYWFKHARYIYKSMGESERLALCWQLMCGKIKPDGTSGREWPFTKIIGENA